jgi:hypothetical protein
VQKNLIGGFMVTDSRKEKMEIRCSICGKALKLVSEDYEAWHHITALQVDVTSCGCYREVIEMIKEIKSEIQMEIWRIPDYNTQLNRILELCEEAL